MSIKFEILKLKHGENYIVPESDYGKADIWLINETYILFEIPWLGGTPQFVKASNGFECKLFTKTQFI